jgi:hypothetical protein
MSLDPTTPRALDDGALPREPEGLDIQLNDSCTGVGGGCYYIAQLVQEARAQGATVEDPRSTRGVPDVSTFNPYTNQR